MVIRWSLTGQRYVDEVLPQHVVQIYQIVSSFSKTIPAHLQYGKELFAGWSCHTHLTGLPGPDPSPIGRPWDILGQQIHDRIPYQLPHFPNSNTSWFNNGNVFHKGRGYNNSFLLSMPKSLIECINKGGGHTRYDLQYILSETSKPILDIFSYILTYMIHT